MSDRQGLFYGKRVPEILSGKPLLYPRYNSVAEIIKGKKDAQSPGNVDGTPANVKKRKPRAAAREAADQDMEAPPHAAPLEPATTNSAPAATAAGTEKKRKRQRAEQAEESAVQEVEVPTRNLTAQQAQAAPDVEIAANGGAEGAAKKKDKKKRRRDADDSSNAAEPSADPSSKDQTQKATQNTAEASEQSKGNLEEAQHIRQVLGFKGGSSRAAPTFSFGFPVQQAADGEAQQQAGVANGSKPPAEAEDMDPETKAKLDWIMLADSATDGFVPRRVYIGGMPYTYDEEAIRECWAECGEIEDMHLMRFPDSGRFNGIAFITFASEEGYNKALGYDGEELEGHSLKVTKCKLSAFKKVHKASTAAAAPQSHTAAAWREPPTRRAPQHAPGSEPLKTPGYHVAYVGNLAFEAKTWEVMELFKESNPTRVRLHTDKETGKPKGFAHVHFNDEASLDKAMAMDGAELLGRCIKVKYGQPKKGET